jgi:hypothetical protein
LTRGHSDVATPRLTDKSLLTAKAAHMATVYNGDFNFR